MAKSRQAAAGVDASMFAQAIEYPHRGKIELDWRKGGFDLASHSAECQGGESVGFVPVASRLDAGQGGGYLAPRSRSCLRQLKSLFRRVMELLRSSR